ncbi:MAG: Smr/MutS family protein [Flavipsychrobacter sp.]|nr:Smr/MutS family protein [Flavipsychrobacter sp.]
MKFSIGDRIVLRQTGEEGHVTGFIGKDMLEVDVNGTTFPVYAELVDHPYLKWFTEKKTSAKRQLAPEDIPVEKEKLRPKRLAKGVYLSFLPVYRPNVMEDIVDVLKIHLLNELGVPVRLSYDVRIDHECTFRHEGVLHAFGNLYLHSISWEDMSRQPRFHWQLSDGSDTALAPAADVLRIRPAKLFEHVNELLQKNEPAFSVLLADEFHPPRPEPPKEKFIPRPASQIVNQPGRLHTEAPVYELDLHIEKLTNDTRGMDNADMLHLQMRTFEKYLRLAIVHSQERMIVIHGLGKGVLRYSVHELLSRTPEVARYTNEYHPRYGFGATEIYFK